MGDQVESEQVTEPDAEGGTGRKRDRTLIEFPYSDMARAHELTKTLSEAGGKVWIDQTQLAVAMDMSVGGGTFRGRISAARMFGFVETDTGKVRLSDLGIHLLDDATERAAKIEAFLRVPLYKAMYDSYNGFALPPAAAIERQMQSMGVPPKQAERARQAFAASAQAAGYIATNGRFSKPTSAPVLAREDRDASQGGGGGNNGGSGQANPQSDDNSNATNLDGRGGGNSTGSNHHPLIAGLLVTLPKVGEPWPEADRKAWLTMAESIFAMIYTKGSDVKRPETNTAADR